MLFSESMAHFKTAVKSHLYGVFIVFNFYVFILLLFFYLIYFIALLSMIYYYFY